MQAVTLRTRAAATEEPLSWTARPDRRLALATMYPLEYAKVLQQTPLGVTGIPLAVLEQRAFAMDHRELCSAMLADWGFPRIFHLPAFAEQPTNRAVAEELARVCNGSFAAFVVVHRGESSWPKRRSAPFWWAVCSR